MRKKNLIGSVLRCACAAVFAFGIMLGSVGCSDCGGKCSGKSACCGSKACAPSSCKGAKPAAVKAKKAPAKDAASK